MRPVLVRFDTAEACAQAILALKKRGIEVIEAYSPYPDKSVAKALAAKKSPLPRIVFAAGLCGGLLAYTLIWFTNVVDYPINVGGRPHHAVPAFIPLTFETTVLFAGFAAFTFGLLLGGLPRYYDPVFEVPDFERVMIDGWFLAVKPREKRAKPQEPSTRIDLDGILSELGAQSVTPYGPDREDDA